MTQGMYKFCPGYLEAEDTEYKDAFEALSERPTVHEFEELKAELAEKIIIIHNLMVEAKDDVTYTQSEVDKLGEVLLNIIRRQDRRPFYVVKDGEIIGEFQRDAKLIRDWEAKKPTVQEVTEKEDNLTLRKCPSCECEYQNHPVNFHEESALCVACAPPRTEDK